MKKSIISCLFMLLLSNIICAQNIRFQLSESGKMYTSNNETYEVIHFPNTTKEELYNRILIAISSQYVNPQKVISSITNEMISISAFTEEIPFITVSTAMGKISFSPGCDYVLKFYFKDNKLRIDAPVIVKVGSNKPVEFDVWLRELKVYKKGSPNPKHQKTIDSVNDYFESLINDILNANNIVNDDW